MPQVVDSPIAIRVLYDVEKKRIKLQYRGHNELGETCWITAPIVDQKGDPIGYSLELILEKPNYGGR